MNETILSISDVYGWLRSQRCEKRCVTINRQRDKRKWIASTEMILRQRQFDCCS